MLKARYEFLATLSMIRMKTLAQLALEMAGDDPQAMSVDQTQAFIDRLSDDHSPWARIEHVSVEVQLKDPPQWLARAHLAQDVISPINVPSHTNSAMDGYAFLMPNSKENLKLKVVGSSSAGHPYVGPVGLGECIKIMTGAVVPEGLDTVVAQEMVHAEGDWIEFPLTQLQAGDNRRHQGEDLQKGGVALKKGQRLNAACLGLLASLGLQSVKVINPPKVAIFSTGDEIKAVGTPLEEGQIYDSNRPTLMALLNTLGVEVMDLGICPDDPEELKKIFTLARENAQVIITSAGVSAGERDFTKELMTQMGDVVFWHIAMRPGRPMAVGRLQETLLFGLPGNPVAVMVTFLAFVRPALLKLMGSGETHVIRQQAVSLEHIRKKPGRTEYQRGVFEMQSNGLLNVRLSGNQGSGILSSMVNGNCLVVLAHDQGDVQIGQSVEIWPLEGLI
jgi:molybdopterin molybdotransferase